jgi:hypothetical protein
MRSRTPGLRYIYGVVDSQYKVLTPHTGRRSHSASGSQCWSQSVGGRRNVKNMGVDPSRYCQAWKGRVEILIRVQSLTATAGRSLTWQY